MANEICHLEFLTPDIERAGGFFSKVFGWSVSPMGEAYALWQTGEGELDGGLSTHGVEQQGPGTLAYIHVDDIEAMLAKINEAGGTTVIPKTKISDEHGFFAVFAEPGGAAVGLWSKS